MAIGAGGPPQVMSLWVTEAPSKVEAGQSPTGDPGGKAFRKQNEFNVYGLSSEKILTNLTS